MDEKEIDILQGLIKVLSQFDEKMIKAASTHIEKAINIGLAEREVKNARNHLNELIQGELKRQQKERINAENIKKALEMAAQQKEAMKKNE